MTSNKHASSPGNELEELTLLWMYFYEISSEGYQSHLWWVFAAVWDCQKNVIRQSLQEQSDRSRYWRMQVLSTSHALTWWSQSIFCLLAFGSLRISPKNGILCRAIPFSALGVFEHPPAQQCFYQAYLQNLSQHKIPSGLPQNIRDRMGIKIWHSLTWRHSPFLDPDSFVLTPCQVHWAWPKR